MFKRNEEEGAKMGVAIYFTPQATYMFLCQNESLTVSDDGVLEMVDTKDRYLDITGSILTVEITHASEVEDIISLYQLKALGLPVITINVSQSLN